MPGFGTSRSPTQIIDCHITPCLLQEVFFGEANYRTLYQEVEEKICLILKNALCSEVFVPFVKGGIQQDSYVEKKFKLKLNDQIKISGEVDVAYEEGDLFVICDWKTGKVDDGDDSMQLLVYTWWAMDELGVALENVKLYKAYLLENGVKAFRLSEKEFFMNKMAIRQSAEVMLEMAEFGVEGDWSAFTPCNQPKICSLCPFQKICQ